MGKVGRPRMTRKDYLCKYKYVIIELRFQEKSLRQISRQHKLGLSTVMRLKKKFVW